MCGQKQSNDIIQNSTCSFSDQIFDQKDTTIINDYLKEIKTFYANILDYLEGKQNNEENLQNADFTFIDHEIYEDKYRLKLFLNLFCKIADNHNRSFNIIQKIQNILKSMKNEIQNYYTNDQIFNIFKTNKKLLLFLFKEKIIIPNKHIFSCMTKYKNVKKKYPIYFYPEFKSFYTEELAKEYKIDTIDLDNFDEKREIGENEYYIAQLIRDDLIDDFIIYTTKNSISLTSTLNSSIFETNDFLIGKNPTLLEYAAFYGSIQIFQYIRLNNIELTSDLWLYAIHGTNPDIIHLLEENNVIPNSYKQCLLESIKCHHNDIKEYFENNYNNQISDLDFDNIKQGIKYFNFIELSKDHIKRSDVFYYLCKYDYCQIIRLLENTNFNKIDINWQRKKQVDNKDDGFHLNFMNYEFQKFEKKYEDNKTPLIAAIENGNIEIVEMLLQKRDINVQLKFKSSFQILYDGNYCYLNGGDTKSILYIAAENGYHEIVQLLINRKDIDINEINIIKDSLSVKTMTALHIAVTNEHIETVSKLLDAKNINPNIIESDTISHSDCSEKTPLNIAIEKENAQIVKLLLSNEKTDINHACYFYIHCIVCDAPDYNIPVNNFTPLQMAVEKENKEIVQMLLDTNNVKINQIGLNRMANDRGVGYKNTETALHIAVEKNNFDIVQMLLSYNGIDVNSISLFKEKNEKYVKCYVCYDKIWREKTPLLIAVENENLKIVELLLKNANVKKNKKLTITKKIYDDDAKMHKTIEKIDALSIAVEKNNNSIIDILK